MCQGLSGSTGTHRGLLGTFFFELREVSNMLDKATVTCRAGTHTEFFVTPGGSRQSTEFRCFFSGFLRDTPGMIPPPHPIPGVDTKSLRSCYGVITELSRKNSAVVRRNPADSRQTPIEAGTPPWLRISAGGQAGQAAENGQTCRRIPRETRRLPVYLPCLSVFLRTYSVLLRNIAGYTPASSRA